MYQGKLKYVITFFIGCFSCLHGYTQTATSFYNKAVSFYKNSNYQEAIEHYTVAISLKPTAYAYVNRGRAKYALGNYAEAIKDYDNALVINAKYAPAYYHRGNAKYNLAQYEQAIADYDECLALTKSDAYTYNCRGNAKVKTGHDSAAIADYNLAIAYNPDMALAYYNRAVAKVDLGHAQDAIEDFDKALNLNHKDAETYTGKGYAKFLLSKYTDAVNEYDQAIAVDSLFAHAYYNRSLAKYALGLKQEAATDYKKAVLLDAKYDKAIYNKAMLKNKLQRFKDAIPDFDQAILYDSTYSNAYLGRGYARFSLHDYGAALEDYNRAIAFDSANKEAYNYRGYVYLQQKQYKEAITDYDKAKQIGGKNYEPLFNYRDEAGVVYYKDSVFLSVSAINFKDTNANKQLDANEKDTLAFVITNKGKGPAKEVKIYVENILKNKGLTINYSPSIGSIEPMTSITVPIILIAADTIGTGPAQLKITFEERNNHKPDSFEYTFVTKALDRPEKDTVSKNVAVHKLSKKERKKLAREGITKIDSNIVNRSDSNQLSFLHKTDSSKLLQETSDTSIIPAKHGINAMADSTLPLATVKEASVAAKNSEDTSANAQRLLVKTGSDTTLAHTPIIKTSKNKQVDASGKRASRRGLWIFGKRKKRPQANNPSNKITATISTTPAL